MKVFLSILIAILIIIVLCFSYNKKIFRKKVKTGDMEVQWYYESYITSIRGFIDVKKDGRRENILDFDDFNVTDIDINHDTIFLKIYRPSQMIIYSKKNRVFDYAVIIDSSVTYLDYLRVYQPDVYNSLDSSMREEYRREK